ncbi:MAG: 50S ribosomal protein L24 [Catalinimonas sp.]
MKKKPTQKIKLKIKTGDEVVVISGNHKGRRGRVVSVDAVRNRAIVEDVNVVQRALKPTAANPQQGGFQKKEAPLHISNLKLIDPVTGEPTRVGRRADEDGKLKRFSKKTGEFIKE